MTGTVFDWFSSNSSIEYPFQERQVDDLHELFVDAYVIHSKNRTLEKRLRVDFFNPSGFLTLKFEDGTLLATLVPADNFLSSVFGKFTLYEWRRSSVTGPGFTSEDIVARLVVLTSKLTGFSFPVSSATAYLLPSLVNPRVKRVRRIGVALPGAACCVAISSKQVILEAGNNMEVLLEEDTEAEGLGIVEEDTVRPPRTLVLNATAGAGTGRFPTCTSLEPAIRRVNKVGADARGNLQLAATDCLWTELRLAGPVSAPIRPNTDYLGTLMASLIQLHADCVACCACDDYGETYTNIKALWDRALGASNRVEALRLRYNTLCEAVLALKTSKEVGLKAHVRVVSRPDFHLAISGIVVNNSAADIAAVLLKFKLNRSDAAYVEGSGIVEAEDLHNQRVDPAGSAIPGFTVTLPSLRAAHYGAFSFEVRFSAAPRAGVSVQVTFEASSGAQLAADVKSTTLVKPLTKA